MSKLETITVAMPEDVTSRMQAAVDAGEYATPGEIVREVMREWAELQDRRTARLDELRASLDLAAKGPFVDGPGYMAALRAKLAARVAADGDI